MNAVTFTVDTPGGLLLFSWLIIGCLPESICVTDAPGPAPDICRHLLQGSSRPCRSVFPVFLDGNLVVLLPFLFEQSGPPLRNGFMRPVLIDATLWIPIYDFPSNRRNMTELQEIEMPEIGNIEVEKSSKHSSKPVAGTSNRFRMSDEASAATSYSGSNSEGSESAHPLCGDRTCLNV